MNNAVAAGRQSTHGLPPRSHWIETVRRALLTFTFAAYLAACGGGGDAGTDGGGGGGGDEPPPSGLSYTSPNVYAVGKSITPLEPTVTGTVTSYAVSPPLPAGLAFSADSGKISGTPSAVTAKAAYTVTASNSAGSTTFPVSITVNDVPPLISYETTNPPLTVGVPVQGMTPSNRGGAVVSWSVSPSLPTGLSLSNTDGSITGTPTAEFVPAIYLVTAENSAGRSSVNLTMGVASVLLDLGHSSLVVTLKRSASHALSRDGLGHWVLWDYSTGAMIASGDSDCAPPVNVCGEQGLGFMPIDFAGPTLAVGKATGIDMLSTADGQRLASIPAKFSWMLLAVDGNYVVAGSEAGLYAWSPSGESLISRPGDYSRAKAYAASGEIRVAKGAAGDYVIETISVPTGSSSVSPPFQWDFHSWFLDGERFLTVADIHVRVHSKTAAQQDETTLPTVDGLTGQGHWFWTRERLGGPLEIYAVGASTSPTASYPVGVDRLVPSGTTLGWIRSRDGGVTVIDLSGASPSAVDHPVPVISLTAYAAISASQWMVGNYFGVVLDGESLGGVPKYFGFGTAFKIAGSASRGAIATASGRLLHFDVGTRELKTIELLASNLAMSDDGSVLAAGHFDYRQPGDDLSISILSLPSGSEIYKWPYSDGVYPRPLDLSLSGSGTALGQVLESSGGHYTRQVSAPNGGAVTWSDFPQGGDHEGPPPIRLSPAGDLIAVSSGPRSQDSRTQIYKDGIRVATVPGWPVGWIDGGRLLVNEYDDYFMGCSIYDPTGAKLASSPLRQLFTFERVSADSVYSAWENNIFSLTSGKAIWTSSHRGDQRGAIVGSYVVFQSGARVFVEPY